MLWFYSAVFFSVEMPCFIWYTLSFQTVFHLIYIIFSNSVSFDIHYLFKLATDIQGHGYKTLAQPLLEYSSPVWDPHQQNLVNTLEMAQHLSARRICKDFSPFMSATSLIEKPDIHTLKERRNIDKVTMLYKIKMGEVETLADNIPKTTARSTRGQTQTSCATVKDKPPPAFLLPLSHPTLGYSPISFHCSSLSTGLQGLLEGVSTQCLKTPSTPLCFIYLFIYLFICLFIYLFIHSLIYFFCYLSIYLFIYLLTYLYLVLLHVVIVFYLSLWSYNVYILHL